MSRLIVTMELQSVALIDGVTREAHAIKVEGCGTEITTVTFAGPGVWRAELRTETKVETFTDPDEFHAAVLAAAEAWKAEEQDG